MKMPRTIKRYCPYCKTHTEQEVERVKKKKASELKWGQRRFRKVTAGYGECKKANISPCIRAKKFELTE